MKVPAPSPSRCPGFFLLIQLLLPFAALAADQPRPALADKPALTREIMPRAGRGDSEESANQPPVALPKTTVSKPVALPLTTDPETIARASGIGPTIKGLSGKQIRAVWVRANGADLKTADNRAELVKRLKAMNISDIFLEVRQEGAAYYRSSLAPRPSGWIEKDCDPLGDILRQIRPGGAQTTNTLRVHAVFDVLRLLDTASTFDPPAGHLLREHPEWVMQNREGRTRDPKGVIWLDPGVPGAAQHLEALARELASSYPLDGIHFTGLCYPGGGLEWGYNSKALEAFRAARESGKKNPASGGDEDEGEDAAKNKAAALLRQAPAPNSDEWVRWRANRLTSLLETLSQAVREERRGILVSASVIATGDAPSATAKTQADYVKKMQWWPTWCVQGLVDWVVLENDFAQSSGEARFVKWLDFAASRKGKCQAIALVSGPNNLDTGVVRLMQTALARESDGIVLYSLQNPASNLTNADQELAYISKTVYSSQYIMPPYLSRGILASLPEKAKTFPEMDLKYLPDLSPKPAATPRPSPTPEPAMAMEDAAYALMGKKAPPKRTPPFSEETDKATSRKKAKEVRFEIRQGDNDLPNIPEFANTLKQYKVELKSGRAFIAAMVGDNTSFSVFQVRGQDQLITIPKKEIRACSPVQD